MSNGLGLMLIRENDLAVVQWCPFVFEAFRIRCVPKHTAGLLYITGSVHKYCMKMTHTDTDRWLKLEKKSWSVSWAWPCSLWPQWKHQFNKLFIWLSGIEALRGPRLFFKALPQTSQFKHLFHPTCINPASFTNSNVPVTSVITAITFLWLLRHWV